MVFSTAAVSTTGRSANSRRLPEGARIRAAVVLFASTILLNAISTAGAQVMRPSARRATLERLPPIEAGPEMVPAPVPVETQIQLPSQQFSLSASDRVLSGPQFSEPAIRPAFKTADPSAADAPLPINLATALRLSDARPLIVAAAQARIQIAAAQLERAAVLWLPNINGGTAYINHTGGNQSFTGNLVTDTTSFMYSGGSLEFRVATTDAIFEPLAAKQELKARNIGLQAAKNEALLATAEAYFTVQQARGSFAAMLDATAKSADLVKRVEGLARGLAPRDEIYRARTLHAELEEAAALARQQWQVSSATLTRVLRLNPEAVVVPLEPDFLQISLVTEEAKLDELIPVGLRNRPELASHQAVVKATLARLKQERMRPLIPSILVTGNGTPDFLIQGGVFGTGNGSLNQWSGRSDVSAQVIWRMENLAFGNQGRIRERRGQVDLAMVELFQIQDRVAAEVTQAKAELESARFRVGQAERGLHEGVESYKGNLRGLGQTTRFGDLLTLVNRPQEVVASLQQLQQAYLNYYKTVADYNRAQFRLFYSLGFPASILACEQTPGVPEPVDTSRPGYMPAVCAGEPCACRP